MITEWVFVLVFLAALFSVLTIKQQHPTGEEACRRVADLITQKYGREAQVLIVTRNTVEDQAFADAAAKQLITAGPTVLACVSGAAPDARRAIESILEQGGRIDAIAANDVTAKWSVYDPFSLQSVRPNASCPHLIPGPIFSRSAT